MFKKGKIPKLDKDSAESMERLKSTIDNATAGIVNAIDEALFNLARDTGHKYGYAMFTNQKYDGKGTMNAEIRCMASDDPGLPGFMKVELQVLREYIAFSGNRNWQEAEKDKEGLFAFLKKWKDTHERKENGTE